MARRKSIKTEMQKNTVPRLKLKATKMARLWSCSWPTTSLLLPCTYNKRMDRVNCCSVEPNRKNKGSTTETPRLLKVAVSGLTELLRLVSPVGSDRTITEGNELKNDVSVMDINDVLAIIESDYGNAYFVTGQFTSAIYAEDCTFEDPTIKFQGTKLYARNLTLLVPFFEDPSIQLGKIEKSLGSEADCIVATWKLRTYLKLPWKPLISVDGRTTYDLDEKVKIVRHVESWNVSALEAIIQIFTPSSGRSDK